MNESDLREIGVNSLGARRKFLSTIEYYQTRTNHYRISEEFLVNTWVSKQDLAELRHVWHEMMRTVGELRIACKLPHVERLVKQVRRGEEFFKKY